MDQEKKPLIKKKKLKCTFCKKKLGIVNYTCKSCSGRFCSVHRYTHSHKCPNIDVKKKENKENIQNNNPKMKADKIEKI